MFSVGDTCVVGLYVDLDAAACCVAPARTASISNSSLLIVNESNEVQKKKCFE